MRFFHCIYPALYWLKVGAYWRNEQKGLYIIMRRLLSTLRWMVLDVAIQKITDNVCIGDVESLMDAHVRKENGIGAVLCCAEELERKTFKTIRYNEHELYWSIPLKDSQLMEKENIESGLQFIRLAIKLKQKVLVACAGGASRSAGIILCYMIEEGWDMNKALSYMQKIRPIINPHPLILLSIRRYYGIPPY
jgi:protein-tyrosine phosphatase